MDEDLPTDDNQALGKFLACQRSVLNIPKMLENATLQATQALSESY
jgi:hypothetical protein